MNRINGPGATGGNLFTEGYPPTQTPATDLTAKWLNAVQEELVGIVLAGGLTLNDANAGQVLAALYLLLLKRSELGAASGVAGLDVDGRLAQNVDGGKITVGTVAAARLDAAIARLASPAFTGTPTAPTASQGADSDQLATLTYVRAAAAAIVGGAPSTLDALNELATALGSDPNFATTMATALGNKEALVNKGAASGYAALDVDGRLAQNVDGGKITVGTVAAARIDAAIARDAEVTAAVAAEASVRVSGEPPIGAILAVSGTYAAGDNTTGYNTTGVSIGAGWKLCDGSVISDGASPFDGRYVPKLDDGRFLRGSTASGGQGGSATKNPSTSFAAAGNYTPTGGSHSHAAGTLAGDSHTLTAAESGVPAHTHPYTDPTHNHLPEASSEGFLVTRAGFANYTGGIYPVKADAARTGNASIDITINANTTAGAASGHSHAVSGSTAGSGSLTLDAIANSAFFLNAAVNLEPPYLNVRYYQRIK